MLHIHKALSKILLLCTSWLINPKKCVHVTARRILGWHMSCGGGSGTCAVPARLFFSFSFSSGPGGADLDSLRARGGRASCGGGSGGPSGGAACMSAALVSNAVINPCPNCARASCGGRSGGPSRAPFL